MVGNNQIKSLIDYPENLPYGSHSFSYNAMATVFGIFIIHEDARYAEQAAYDAFCELDRLEQELSRFIENSDISRINSSAANYPVSVGPDAFACLEQCSDLWTSTNKAFDITIGPLLRCFYTKNILPRIPTDKEIEYARDHTGMHFVNLEQKNYTVTLKSTDMCIDLGGFGKGYAVDCIAEILNDWDIKSALIHGGKSSVLALDAPPGERGWRVTINNPNDIDHIVSNLYLKNQAVSGSGIRKGQHIIDPRTANPVKGRHAAWALTAHAAAGDALSTAFMIMSAEEISEYCSSDTDAGALIIEDTPGQRGKILRFGKSDFMQ